jgi:hypothetical protein
MTHATALEGRTFKVDHQHRWYRIETHLVQPGTDNLLGIECYADGRPVPDGAELSGSPFIDWTNPNPFDQAYHGRAWELDLGPRAHDCFLIRTPDDQLVITTLRWRVPELVA